jgi:hypothetical protein
MRTKSDFSWLLQRLGSSRWDMYRSGRCSSREASARISSMGTLRRPKPIYREFWPRRSLLPW